MLYQRIARCLRWLKLLKPLQKIVYEKRYERKNLPMKWRLILIYGIITLFSRRMCRLTGKENQLPTVSIARWKGKGEALSWPEHFPFVLSSKIEGQETHT
mmetsp:Transcript_43460/g.170010  ORF Transcript_43460/g.170010 Transcript_43460/m.170010 type:complete len:100 (+) Transcript_43460:1334-1633(+)